MKYKILKYIEKVVPSNIKKILMRPMISNILVNQTRSSVSILIKFLLSKNVNLSFKQKIQLLKRFNKIRLNVTCAHSFNELMIPIYHILSTPSTISGCIIEAGSYKGGSTSKLSVVAKLCNRKLYVFDSFEGLPDNDEPIAHTTMGYTKVLNKGEFCGTLEEVKKNVGMYGEIKMCKFVKGWFEDTMPNFKENIVAVFCDVDLLSSTKTCLKFLWPRLINRGFFFSQDAHIPIIKEFFNNKNFWKDELGLDYAPPFHNITKRFGYFIKEK